MVHYCVDAQEVQYSPRFSTSFFAVTACEISSGVTKLSSTELFLETHQNPPGHIVPEKCIPDGQSKNEPSRPCPGSRSSGLQLVISSYDTFIPPCTFYPVENNVVIHPRAARPQSTRVYAKVQYILLRK
ncbi:hypothetical protein M406DRAFT_101282, partial [Cryphonectria parasitica EP155]